MTAPFRGGLPALRPMLARRLAATLVAAAVLTACSGADTATEEPSTPPAADVAVAQPTASPAPAESPDEAAELLYSEADMTYLEEMILHHEQALELAALVPARTEREELLRYAEDVEAVQAGEIEFMLQFLDEAMAERGGAKVHADHGHDDMPGMLSDDEIVAMAQTSGAEFEQAFLEGMIRHHEGALHMAEEQMASESRSLGLADLAQHIVEDQTYEIGLMLSWLRDWGLSDDSSP